MSKSSKQRSLLNELEHAEIVLRELLLTISNLNSILEPIEREMKVSDFVYSGELLRGVSEGVVCVLSGLIKGDPLEMILAESGRGKGIPSIIRTSDRTESKMTVESIVNMLHTESQKGRLGYVINLRWARLPAPLEKENTVIIGTRYISGSSSRLMELESNLERAGLRIIRDNGEFGGGPLVYEVIRSFSDEQDLVVAELTLSNKVIEDTDVVIQILNILASF